VIQIIIIAHRKNQKYPFSKIVFLSLFFSPKNEKKLKIGLVLERRSILVIAQSSLDLRNAR